MSEHNTQSRRRVAAGGSFVRLPRRIAGSGGEPVKGPIEAALSPRVEVGPVATAVAVAHATLREELEACQGYRNGLPAELASAKSRKSAAVAQARKAARQAILSRTGRRIDLVALLKQSRPDSRPVWSIADPMANLASQNGGVDNDGDFCIARFVPELKRWVPATINASGHYTLTRQFSFERGRWQIGAYVKVGHKSKNLTPGGIIPPIPAQVREIVTDSKIRRRARWVGLLFQPVAWTETPPDKDPAIVVEWTDRPGEYYCLALWGHDGPAIMEFVD